jgi:type II secretory pathway pseudopilin PulG
MTGQTKQHHNENGFSLVETVIGITIVALIIGAAVAGLKVFYQKEKLDKTTHHRTQIETAIGEYVNKYGALPCPAPLIGVNYNSPNFGRQVNCRAGAAPTATVRVPGRSNMDVHIGAVPARDLGLPLEVMTDSWGNQFTYAVTEDMTTPGSYALPAPDIIISSYDSGGMVEVPQHIINEWSTEGNSVIRKNDHLYIVTNTNNSDTQEIVMVIGYFDVEEQPEIPPGAVNPDGTPIPMPAMMPFPDIVRNGATSCVTSPPQCIPAIDITANMIDYNDLLYDVAAVEVQQKLADGTFVSLSPENPETGALEPGHLSFAVISHGPSGMGAFNPQIGAVTQACPATGTTSEAQNCDYNSGTALDIDPISGIANASVFTLEAGFSIAGSPETDVNYHDDIVSHSRSVESWPPRELCDPGTGELTGLRLKNPDGSWGECRDVGGDQGPPGPKGPRGPTGPQGAPGNVALGLCDPGKVLKGFDSAGDKICVDGGPPLSSIPVADLMIIQRYKAPGAPIFPANPPGFNLGNNQAYAECPATHKRIACGGSREENVVDNASEEDGAYVGTIPWGSQGCITGVDFEGGIEAVAIAYCMKLD